ncbi:hypothetical protein AVEN_198924-1 [Araneus ventricosus]|uniref:Uncharacterized protein n=1 Tax=Araneus ventricosus TaxID=182803 RepID=A0A4Y2T4B9_ARAVE|nr:hypothetical protein AVEN_198924-1 [Araneus ventricosus]
MIYGPCGVPNMKSPCMKDKKFPKRYPRKMTCETQTAEDGFPLYRQERPNKESIQQLYVNLRIDNKFDEVVPCLSTLSKLFHAHINVEYFNSVKSIKCICKYINKGSDMAVVKINIATTGDSDEVTWYQIH